MNGIDTQIARLKRHFEACRLGYDPVSLLDLAHSLRVIGESRAQFKTKIVIANSKCFQSVVQPKKVKEVLRGKRFVMALFPRMVKTGNISVAAFALVLAKISDDQRKILERIKGASRVSYDLDTWFQAEAIAWRSQADGPRKSISRERIVKRVANYLGGSHPFGNAPETESDDDKSLKELMGIEVAERPTPYLILMSIALELLIAVGEVEPPKEEAEPPKAGTI